MGTRSRIGIRNADDTVDSIYCHWDGYPSHNGRLLVEHYTDEALVRGLIALGDLSSLGKEIGVQHPFNSHDFPGGHKEHEKLYGNMCTAYGRDRGETNVDPEHSHSADAFLRISCGAEYYYIFHYGRWMVRSGSNWVLVEDVLREETKD